MRILIAIGIVAVLLLAGLYYWDTDPEHPAPEATLSPDSLSAAAEAFSDPPAEWEYRFPADHGNHPEQFGEYWWFAGRLRDDTGRMRGFQLAIYRLALSREPPDTASRWDTRDLYRGQFLLEPYGSDPVHAEERFGRDALDLSGSDEQRAWIEDWSVVHDPDCRCFRLRASTSDSRLHLTLHPSTPKPVHLRGIPGLDPLEPGSHGYWWPGLQVTGEFEHEGELASVTGDAVLEHVWGRRLPVAQGQLTLNRLWLSLDDGTAVRCMQLRRRGPGGVPLGDCLIHAPDAEPARIASAALAPVEAGDGDYPLHWRLEADEPRIALGIRAPRERAAPAFRLPLWSGLMQADGSLKGEPVQGWGWLELSGY
ncbi:MAG: lipocalin-like domain-containing protein [Pseudomonadota bacterium]